jgi:hypothetical protein
LIFGEINTHNRGGRSAGRSTGADTVVLSKLDNITRPAVEHSENTEPCHSTKRTRAAGFGIVARMIFRRYGLAPLYFQRPCQRSDLAAHGRPAPSRAPGLPPTVVVVVPRQYGLLSADRDCPWTAAQLVQSIFRSARLARVSAGQDNPRAESFGPQCRSKFDA